MNYVQQGASSSFPNLVNIYDTSAGYTRWEMLVPASLNFTIQANFKLVEPQETTFKILKNGTEVDSVIIPLNADNYNVKTFYFNDVNLNKGDFITFNLVAAGEIDAEEGTISLYGGVKESNEIGLYTLIFQPDDGIMTQNDGDGYPSFVKASLISGAIYP